MSAAAQTPGLTNHSTGAERLLSVARWLVAIILIRWLILRGRELAAHLEPHAAAGVIQAVRRAVALEAELLAIHPAGPEMADIAHRRAIAAVIIEICRGLGIFRPLAAPAPRRRRIGPRSGSRRGHHPSILRMSPDQARLPPSPAATGPPRGPHLARYAHGRSHANQPHTPRNADARPAPCPLFVPLNSFRRTPLTAPSPALPCRTQRTSARSAATHA